MELDYVKLKEIKPVLAGYIREAQSLLSQAPVPDEKVVHDVRVLMKKSRSVMKLIINQIDKEAFNRDYTAFREVGRIMRLWRETSVHRKTLKELKKEHPKIFSMLHENQKLEALMKRDENPEESSPDIKNDLKKIEDILNKAGFRVRFRALNNVDPKMLIKELNNTYNIIVDRKRTKDFLYQLYFFRPLNPSVVKALEKRVDTLTQNLGKYNDLAQLIKTLEYKYSSSANLPALDELIVVIREAQDRYLSKVWPAAYKIFCPGQKLVNILGFRLLMI
jgi:CHAD domain-containing protein